ncbi:MAG: DNA methyltransferase [Terricaulis sp.]
MIKDALKDVSERGDIVIDPFGGSGSTLIAAESTGRCARLIELDPVYCDVIVARYEALSGKTANLAETGATFEETATNRRPSS